MTKLTAKTKKTITYLYTTNDIAKGVITEAEARLALISIVQDADVNKEEVMRHVMAAREYAYQKGEAMKSQNKGFPFPEWDIKAQAHFIAFAKGTANAKTAKAEKKVLLTDAQYARVRHHARWWNRLLKEAGVAPVSNKGKNSKKRGTKKPAVTKAPPKVAKGLAVFKDKVTPRVTTPKDAVNYVQQGLNHLLAFCKQNMRPTEKGKASPTEALRPIIAKALEDLAKAAR